MSSTPQRTLNQDLLRNELPCHAQPGNAGQWSINTFTISEADARFHNLRAAIKGESETFVTPGTFTRLSRGKTVVMSNTPFEVVTNTDFIRAAKGRVLINGLGLGMVVSAILRKPEVTEIVIIEKSPEVIGLVGPAFAHENRVRIINADCFEYTPPKGERFDAVWHDIWDTVCADNLPQMRRLERKYKDICDWQESWCKKQCQSFARKTRTWLSARKAALNPLGGETEFEPENTATKTSHKRTPKAAFAL